MRHFILKKTGHNIKFMETEIILSAVSAVLIILGVYFWQKNDYLLSNGKKAKGIIFKNVKESSVSDRGNAHYYPVVRFLTEKKEWITEKLLVGYSHAMKEGTEVDVLYDPDEPNNVVLDSTFQLVVLPRLLVALGILGFLTGILEFLAITDLIN